MYYISREDSSLQVSAVKKRLKDFSGQEGEFYHVRKKRSTGGLMSVPVYVYQDGKLKPTKRWSVFGLFNRGEE